MHTRILLLGIALSGAACGRLGGKPGLPAKTTETTPPRPEASRPAQPTRIRTVPASSDGALELLGIHPFSAILHDHPGHILRVPCTFDHPLEGDVIARFLDAKGMERGRAQQHIKTDGSPKELEFKIGASFRIGDIESVHLKLPD